MDQEVHSRVFQLEVQVRRMEAMMQALLERMGINPAEIEPPEPPGQQAIRDTLLSGNKIKAIQLYRELYGADLKSAKDAVDAMERQYRGY